MTKVIPPAPKVKTVLKGQVKRLEPILRQARYKKLTIAKSAANMRKPAALTDKTFLKETS